MKVYAESSAILAWLFGEPSGQQVADVLESANTIATSDLTLAECQRAIHRAVFTGDLSTTQANTLRADLAKTSAHWMVSRINREILDRASRRFPVEPVRTFDAIHLATAIRASRALPGMRILTLDRRVTANGLALGFDVLPAGGSTLLKR